VLDRDFVGTICGLLVQALQRTFPTKGTLKFVLLWIYEVSTVKVNQTHIGKHGRGVNKNTNEEGRED
jgi:hypothetical protein